MKLEVSGLSFAYASDPVLRDVTFSAEGGECVAVLGTNGAGKSTLLKCIDRLLRPSGSVKVDGRELTSLKNRELAKTVAYLPQQPDFPDVTVFDAVLMGRRPYISWDAAQTDLDVVSELLTRLALTPLALRNVNDLSGGERQKTAVARALAQQPRVLLFDEPTSSLDLKNQLETLSIIRELTNSNSLTSIVAIHDLNLALRFADTFILMKNHKVLSAGPKSTLTPASIMSAYNVQTQLTEVAGHTIVVPV